MGKEPKPTDWFAALVRIAGASFPGASSLVQLQAEIDSSSLLNRVQKLEDPISTLHGGVPETARCIYQCLEEQNERLVVSGQTKTLFPPEYALAKVTLTTITTRVMPCRTHRARNTRPNNGSS